MTSFNPDWILPPGASVLDIAEERGWDINELSQRLGYPVEFIENLIEGHAEINFCIACRLSLVLGSTPTFWLTLEQKYRKKLFFDQMADGYQPRTELGRKLLNLRQKYVADGGQLINEDNLDTYSHVPIKSAGSAQVTYKRHIMKPRTIFNEDNLETEDWMLP